MVEKAEQLRMMSDKMFRYFYVYSKSSDELNMETFQAGPFLNQMLGEYMVLLGENGYQFNVDISDREAEISVDVQGMKRITDNVFTNIRKYSDKTKPIDVRVYVDVRRVRIFFRNYISVESARAESTHIGTLTCQKMAEEMAQEEDLVLLCGHYEGIDERVLEEIVTDYVSIGDYVLTGGELPAMVMIDTISRLVPGVLHNDVSAEFESFQDNLLEYPQYSRPEEWRGKKVPPILLSGHHANIEKWRREQSILRTMERRPDLLKESNLTDKEKKWIRQVKRERKEAEKIK